MIYTPNELIRRLGGANQTAQFFGVSKQVVSNWKRRSGHLPAQRYFEQQDLLKAAGIVCHSSLWFPERRKGANDGTKMDRRGGGAVRRAPQAKPQID